MGRPYLLILQKLMNSATQDVSGWLPYAVAGYVSGTTEQVVLEDRRHSLQHVLVHNRALGLDVHLHNTLF